MKIFISAIALAILFISCAQNSNKDGHFQEITKSDDPKSLEYWTSGIILKTNYPLVQLMDTLYQYVRSDSFPSESLKNEIKWMENYKLQLISYYDSSHSMNDSISSFAKADSVISEADSLWNISRDDTTMGMIIYNDIERTRLIFEQFNEYERLLSICNSADQKDLLYKELVKWFKLEHLFSKIYANCVDLYYWGGTIAGPMRTSGYLSIWQSHIDLYQNEYAILSYYDDIWNDTGTFLKPARELLISCCKQALTEYYYPDEDDELYKDLYRETQGLMQDLPMRIDSWIEARKPWEDEMTTDFLQQSFSRNTSGVLIKLANIISSVQ